MGGPWQHWTGAQALDAVEAPDTTECGAHFKELTQAGERSKGPHDGATMTGSRALYSALVDGPFPPGALRSFPQGKLFGLAGYSCPPPADGSLNDAGRQPSDLEGSKKGVMGKQLWEMGDILGQGLRGSISLCSQPTGEGALKGEPTRSPNTFPLPTRRELLVPVLDEDQTWAVDWICAVCMALNSLWGCANPVSQDHELREGTSAVPEMQARIVRGLAEEVTRLKDVKEVTEAFDWGDFFRTRTVDCKGDEVKTAMTFGWENIRPALPKEIGVARLVDICEQGCKHYVEHFPSFLKPPNEWGP